MNAKTVKKIRKYTRQHVNHNFGEGMEALAKLTRKRPKLVPRFLWILLYVPLIKLRYLKYFYRYL